jgi:hypothetical protein
MDSMKTYTIDELNASTKTRMDYQEEHRKMVEHMRAEAPWREPSKEVAVQPMEWFSDTSTNNVNLGEGRWNLSTRSSPFWKDGVVGQATNRGQSEDLTDEEGS